MTRPDRPRDSAQSRQRRERQVLGPSIQQDVDKELQFHLACLAEDLEKDGWSPPEAQREAQRRFGDLPEITMACRKFATEQQKVTRRAEMLDELSQDLKYAARSLVRRPGFTATALFTLALGIGATTALFSVIHGVLLAPLPFPNPQDLVAVWEKNEDGRPMAVAAPNFLDWQESAKNLEAMALVSRSPWPVTVHTGIEPLRARAVDVSASFFPLLGVEPAIGRTFTDEELRFGGPSVVILSHRFWSHHLGGDPDLDSKSLSLGDVSRTIVGVMPPDFRFPENVDLWIPRDLTVGTAARTAHNWKAIARIRAGIPLPTARAEMTTIATRLKALHGEDTDASDVSLIPLRKDLVGSIQKPLWILFGAAGFVLLVACTNLAGAFLARAVDRQRELSIRAAIGAGRSRIVRQLVTETLLLSLIGGFAGFTLAKLLLPALLALRPASLVRVESIQLGGGIFLFSLVTALLAGLSFGLLPALVATRKDLSHHLKEGRLSSGLVGRIPTWNLLVGTEVALALTLLIGCGLLLRSFEQLRSVEPGFDASDVLTADFSLGGSFQWPSGPDDVEGIARLQKQEARLGQSLTGVLDSLATVPGISKVGLINEIPLGGSDSNGAFCFADRPEDELGYASYRVVHGDYFEAMDISLVEGRLFRSTDQPGSQPVIIVDKALAERFWPEESPIGKQICSYGMDIHGREMATIVGVVGSTIHDGFGSPPSPTYYVSAHQRALRAMTGSLVMETTGDPLALMTATRLAVREVEPNLPLTFETMAQRQSRALSAERFQLLLLNLFGLLALVLAAVGIHGVVSFSVARRTREIGIRVALGARPSQMVFLSLRSTLRVVAIGALTGLIVATQFSHLMESLLYEIPALDIPTFLGATGILGLIAIVSCWLPARRSTAVDPIEAIRAD